MLGRITQWLERAGSSLGGANPLSPIDASYGASWWGGSAVDGDGAPLPVVAAGHLPVF